MNQKLLLLHKIDSLWCNVKKPKGQVSFDVSWSHEAKDVELYFRDVVRDCSNDKPNIISKLKTNAQKLFTKYLKSSRLGSGKMWFYFSKKLNYINLKNKNHFEVDPFNIHTNHMPLPLAWMNDESALYYSQVYLRFFIENITNVEYSENIEMCLGYFEFDFEKLDKVTKEQVDLVNKIIDYIKAIEIYRTGTN